MTPRTGLFLLLLLVLAFPHGTARGQAAFQGTVTGTVADLGTHAPLENVSVVLRDRADSTRVLATTTDKDGTFRFTAVLSGDYVVECSLIGHTSFRSRPFTVSEANPHAALPRIELKASALMLEEVEVKSEKSVLQHGMDRRVYNVTHDVTAGSGTAGDLLQNIPSVQVDMDGNVSLRGSQDVTILVDGKKSPLMGKGRADVLQQLPAASIERIEVITNPSARFTPEGTAGIINLVMKKGAGTTLNGDVTANVGEEGRRNASVSMHARPGKLELFGNYSFRDDLRHRVGADQRVFGAPAPAGTYREDNHVLMLPLVHIGSAGLIWHPNRKDQWDLSADYFHRKPTRNALSTIVTRDDAGAILTDRDQLQTGYELESETGITGAFQHDFSGEEHQLRIEANLSNTPQEEPARFLDRWTTPAQSPVVTNVALRQSEKQAHVTAYFAAPVRDSRFEAGYAFDLDRQDIRSDADSIDLAGGMPTPDPTRTYRFRLDQAIHAVYGTFDREFGRFGLMAGLRAEDATVSSDLVTGGAGFTDRYTGLYPTLHLNWKSGERHEVQLSYSRRIRRPESDDLNPFPEFTDPYNMDAGNPRLRPESIHTVELGLRAAGEHLTLAPSVYYRYKTDGFTRVTVPLTDTTFLRTMANLARDRSFGIEPVITLSLGRTLQGNLNANVFHEEIDASNLGFSGNRSVNSWSGAGNLNLSPWAATMLQLNANYRSARLTPQGEVSPSFGLNVGARQNLLRERVSLTLAISDVLKTQRQQSTLDVAGTRQVVVTRRDSQVIYVGATYHYGRPEKKEKPKAIQYEDAP